MLLDLICQDLGDVEYADLKKKKKIQNTGDTTITIVSSKQLFFLILDQPKRQSRIQRKTGILHPPNAQRHHRLVPSPALNAHRL